MWKCLPNFANNAKSTKMMMMIHEKILPGKLTTSQNAKQIFRDQHQQWNRMELSGSFNVLFNPISSVTLSTLGMGTVKVIVL